MPSIVLTDAEWQAVMACMMYAPGRDCIPLLNKIGGQLKEHQERDAWNAAQMAKGNGKMTDEARDVIG